MGLLAYRRTVHLSYQKALKVLTERKCKLMLEYMVYIALVALQLRSFNTGKKEPLLFITIHSSFYNFQVCIFV